MQSNNKPAGRSRGKIWLHSVSGSGPMATWSLEFMIAKEKKLFIPWTFILVGIGTFWW